MRRPVALEAEVVRRADDPAAEVMLPDPVGHDPGRQRVVGRGDPVGQHEAPAAGLRAPGGGGGMAGAGCAEDREEARARPCRPVTWGLPRSSTNVSGAVGPASVTQSAVSAADTRPRQLAELAAEALVALRTARSRAAARPRSGSAPADLVSTARPRLARHASPRPRGPGARHPGPTRRRSGPSPCCRWKYSSRIGTRPALRIDRCRCAPCPRRGCRRTR